MIAQFTGADQRTWDEHWPELQLAVEHKCGGDHRILADSRLPNELFDDDRDWQVHTDAGGERGEIEGNLRRNMKRVPQDQARHYNPLRDSGCRTERRAPVMDTKCAVEVVTQKVRRTTAKVIMTDNEPSFTSVQFKSFALTLHFADPRHQYLERTSRKGTFNINRISSLYKGRI